MNVKIDESVKAHYWETYNVSLKKGKLICVTTLKGEVLPIELLEVIPGQLFRKTPPPDVVSAVVKRSSVEPFERIKRIKAGFQVQAILFPQFLAQHCLDRISTIKAATTFGVSGSLSNPRCSQSKVASSQSLTLFSPRKGTQKRKPRST